MINLIGNIDFLSVGVAIAAMTVMGFTILFSNYKSITNRTFFYFIICGGLWGFFHLMSYRVTNVGSAFIFLRIELFLAVWFVFFIFRLFYVFPSEKMVFFHWAYRSILIPLVIIVSLLTLTPFVFSGISSLTSSGAINTLQRGPAFLVFLISVIGILAFSFILFSLKTQRAPQKERSKFYLLLIGAVMSFSLIVFFIPIQAGYLNNSNFVPFGAIFLLPFMACASYAIVKHKLFNVRIIGTVFLVFGLSVVGFIEVTVVDSGNLALIFYRSTVLFFIVIFGVALIRGVLNEVRQKEEIARMADDVRRAYVIEKRSKEELEKLDKIKNQFMATLQHDMRTPLTSIMGYTDLIVGGSYGKQNKKTLEIIQKVQGLSRAMITKANEFLDTTKFQLGKDAVVPKPDIDLLSLLGEIYNELEFKAQSKHILLYIEKPETLPHIVADREKLKSAIFNIIDNAIKYTQQGGVTVKAEPGERKMVRVSVKDTGIGIPKEKVPTIFEKQFEREAEAAKVAEGKGIGLYLSGQIIKAHNGKVWATSDGPGKGSTFYVELPMQVSANSKTPENQAQP